MQNVMLPIQMVGDLAPIGASVVFSPGTVIFGAVCYLIGAAKNVSRSYEAIQDLMSMLKDFTVRLVVYNCERVPPGLQMKLTGVFTTLPEVFAVSEKVIKRDRPLRF
ncbi:MAG: hypothetical protein LQ340_003292 [Diploschistes diacapsis]|nr:MAG: hypothetical protein LQ340_003292 [Diploschistes diacapsis]